MPNSLATKSTERCSKSTVIAFVFHGRRRQRRRPMLRDHAPSPPLLTSGIVGLGRRPPRRGLAALSQRCRRLRLPAPFARRSMARLLARDLALATHRLQLLPPTQNARGTPPWLRTSEAFPRVIAKGACRPCRRWRRATCRLRWQRRLRRRRRPLLSSPSAAPSQRRGAHRPRARLPTLPPLRPRRFPRIWRLPGKRRCPDRCSRSCQRRNC
mmetsp:Transcript_14857/g.42100  ORF Transcript_14857/g.42100 Transcript_14857/m.42100 type:complete len:212 (+) Transcript_14857:429-1064(+)